MYRNYAWAMSIAFVQLVACRHAPAGSMSADAAASPRIAAAPLNSPAANAPAPAATLNMGMSVGSPSYPTSVTTKFGAPVMPLDRELALQLIDPSNVGSVAWPAAGQDAQQFIQLSRPVAPKCATLPYPNPGLDARMQGGKVVTPQLLAAMLNDLGVRHFRQLIRAESGLPPTFAFPVAAAAAAYARLNLGELVPYVPPGSRHEHLNPTVYRAIDTELLQGVQNGTKVAQYRAFSAYSAAYYLDIRSNVPVNRVGPALDATLPILRPVAGDDHGCDDVLMGPDLAAMRRAGDPPLASAFALQGAPLRSGMFATALLSLRFLGASNRTLAGHGHPAFAANGWLIRVDPPSSRFVTVVAGSYTHQRREFAAELSAALVLAAASATPSLVRYQAAIPEARSDLRFSAPRRLLSPGAAGTAGLDEEPLQVLSRVLVAEPIEPPTGGREDKITPPAFEGRDEFRLISSGETYVFVVDRALDLITVAARLPAYPDAPNAVP